MPALSLDTNILIYAVDPSAGAKNEVARRVLKAAALAGGALTQQVIGEFLNVSRKMAHLNQRRLRRIAVGMCATFTILPTPKELLFDAFDRSARHGLQYWDAVIATVCLASAINILVSEDFQDGVMIDGLTVLNPFNPDNDRRLATILNPGEG